MSVLEREWDKPPCQLSGKDGNVFAIITRCRRALIDSGQPERADEWAKRAGEADSYDAVLQLAFEYVDVS